MDQLKGEHWDENLIRFYRFGYTTVRATKDRLENGLRVSTDLLLEVKDFEQFPCTPDALSRIFPDEPDDGTTFTNYERHLTKIASLEKPVSVSVELISSFKKHLEDIHVMLGNIETWITEPLYSLEFINERFESNFRIPNIDIVGLPTPLSRYPPPPPTADTTYSTDDCAAVRPKKVCVKCFHTVNEHIYKDFWYAQCPNKREDNRGLFFENRHYISIQTVPVTPNETDIFLVEFDVSSETGQQRLEHFLMAFAPS